MQHAPVSTKIEHSDSEPTNNTTDVQGLYMLHSVIVERPVHDVVSVIKFCNYCFQGIFIQIKIRKELNAIT